MEIYIEGREVGRAELDAWRLKRARRAARLLKIKDFRKISDPDVAVKTVTEFKSALSYDEMLRKMKGKLAFSGFAMKLAAAVSRRRRCSVTVIRIAGITAREVSEGIEGYMTVATRENYRINLAAYPEHYALLPAKDGRFEVVETPGNSPLPVRFFITFGDDLGLATPRDEAFAYQSTGAAMLEKGTVIGGVRHQFKDIEGGCEARLCVEFPSATPRFFANAHRMHLAAEFSFWLGELIKRKEECGR